ncbi:MAG: RsmB/NOP family class I SAM-dependent RNA methyltransferase [Betaproteobacteria bacterium]
MTEPRATPRSRIFANQIAGLAAAIGEVGALRYPADAALHHFFREHREMGQQDRAFVAEGTFAYLRRKRSTEALAESDDARKLALAVIIRDFHASVRDIEPLINNHEAGWLATLKSRAHAELAAAVAADLPDWLWERMGAAYGDAGRTAFAKAWQSPAPLDLRINPGKITREAALSALRAGNLDASPTPFSPLGIRVQGRPQLSSHPLVEDGSIEVQDEGSQLIGFALAPRRGEMVADFCAGAGGKTLLLGALMRSSGRLYAFDVVAKRLANLKPRLARSGLSNVHPQLLTSERDVRVKRLAGKLDRVLVDAPCTGFGTLRRNPDLKWRQTEQGLAELTVKQASILESAATLVKPGGRLVYATCSVLPEENDAIVDAFLGAHPQFREGDVAAEFARAKIELDTGARLRLTPQQHGCDGFFGAILERAA